MRIIITKLLLLIFLQIPVYGQIEITGTIHDGETGEPLPSATIILEDSFRGTISNQDGTFSLIVDKLPVRLSVRYIGYQSETMAVEHRDQLPINVELIPSVAELDEIVVTERDPALSIMERVIARKQLWKSDLNNFKADAYTRQILSSDTSIVSITEGSSALYWDREYGYREIQLSRRQTSNIGEGENFAGVRFLPNFYDDNIEIAGYRLVGITHPDALRYYHFRLMEVTRLDDIPVYKIEVKPRRPLQPLFEGTAYVLGRDYALLEVELKPNDVVSFPPPVQEFNLAYSQQFSNYGGDFWLPVDMRVDGTIRISMVGLRFPPMNFRQVSRLSDYQVNSAIPDSVFKGRPKFVRADTTVSNENDRMEQIPLTMEEQEAYATIDSTKTLEEAFRPEGFLARMAERSDERERSGTILPGLGKFIPDGLTLYARNNRADGVHLGLRQRLRFFDNKTRLRVSGGYSFFSENWDAGASFDQQIGNRITVMSSYNLTTDRAYHSQLYPEGLNSFATLMGADDYFDYYRNERAHLGIRIRQLPWNTTVTLQGNWERHSSFEPEEVSQYSLFGWHNLRRSHPEMDDGNVRSISGSLSKNGPSGSLGFSGNNGFIINGEWAGRGLGSDYSFVKADLIAELSIPTFFQRRLFSNTLDVRFSGGTSWGDLPLQKMGMVDGSMFYFTPFGSLKTRRNLPYAGGRYWVVTAEHNFRTIPFEWIGLTSLADRGWGIILFGGAGQAISNRNLTGTPFDFDGIHTEAGASLNSIFGIMRLDIALRLDQPGTFIGVSVPRYF